jgi:uncharacterized membrane protein SpoIIM required for sporulation
MRFLLAILLTAALGFIAGKFLPWWSIAIVAFLVALLLPQRIGKSFLAGFLGIFLLWSLIAFWIDTKNNSLLSQKVASLFYLGGSSVLLILVTALIGALVGGFAAMSGASLRKG